MTPRIWQADGRAAGDGASIESGNDWPTACVPLYARQIRNEGNARMPAEISDEALDFLLARSGLALTPAQKAELKSVYAGIAAMAERVRKPRGIMAEPAHIYDFSAEDLR